MAEKLRLQDQVAVVTGGSSGGGAAVARAMGAAGAAGVVNYAGNADGAEAVVRDIEAAGGRASSIHADVSKEDEVQVLFEQARARYGTVHILVANFGIQQDAPFLDMTLAQWQRVIDVDLTGQFLCAQAAAREFVQRGGQLEVSKAAGKIICISPVHEVIPWAGHINYAASK